MPHIIYEVSDDLVEKIDFVKILHDVHLMLADLLPTDINSCKSRIHSCNNVLIGDGSGIKHFIHTTIKVKPGRSESVLHKLSEEVSALLHRELPPLTPTYLSVEVVELSTAYSKLPLMT
jgi:5-carboxymethyl-2-hydroxymuconate isomerase